ncbi:MAG: sodium:solute symporter family protein [Proteobacteria bacterium]|nr:sodium:solute symporter family protein [Pseudomonadota bacterium]MDA1352524.1 sodium:solute symporter family protein [Pseudomonadota bacterium]
MDIYTFAIAISVVIFIAVGVYAGRSVKKLDDYFVAGRQAPTLVIVGTLVASVFSTSIFLGEAGFTYDGQLGPYILMPGVAVIGYVYGALFFGTFLRRSRAPTVAEFFGRRFNSSRVQKAAGMTIIVGLGGYLVVVTQGAAILLSELTDLEYFEAIILAWLSYTLFTMYSGSKGVILTDTLMFLLFCGATVFFVFYIVDGMGGVAQAVEDLTQVESKPDIASWHGTVGEGTEWPTSMDYLIWALIVDMSWGFVYAVGPWQSSRHLMARDEHVVIRAAVYACFAVALMQVLIYGIGGLINLANPNISPSETVMIWAAKNLVPSFLGAVLLAGIMAAALSSASTFLSLVGFSISNDIVVRKQELTLRSSRIAMFITGAVVLVLCFIFPPNVFWLMMFIGTVFASSWGPVGFMSIWSKSITAEGAFWGIVLGFFGNVIPATLEYIGLISLPSYFNPALIGASISLIAIIWISKRGTVSAQEEQYRKDLHRTPDVDRDLAKTKRTLWAPVFLVIYGCLMPLMLIKYYVIPYQTGVGQLLADGSVDLSTGESILAMLTAPVFIILGLIVAKVVWSRYSPRQAR